jgi:transcriptional regulator with XRE-family HTH domain
MPRGKRKSRDKLSELAGLFLDLRERAELKQEDAAKLAGITQSKLSRAESDRGIPDVDTTRILAQLYKATPGERKRLIELVELMKPARMDSRLIMHRGRNLRLQEEFLEAERTSPLVRSYSPYMIVGVLQVPGYALNVFTASNARPSAPKKTDSPGELAETRKGRYRNMVGAVGRRYVLIMAEAALDTHVNSPKLMIDQMERLIEASHIPHVRLGIIPRRAPIRSFAPHSFDIYDYRSVVIGTKTATARTTNENDIRDYDALFDDLEQIAVYDAAARALIEQAAAEYRDML